MIANANEGNTMLGTLGFTAAAVAFAVYGYYAHVLAERVPFQRTAYTFSYFLTAAACIVWAAAALGTIDTFSLVITGDALLLSATACLAYSLFPRKLSVPYIMAGAVVAFGLLFLRIANTGTEPFVRDGILVFNTPRVFGAVLGMILLVIWVRANMNFYNKVVDPRFPGLFRASYFSLNLIGFTSAISFLLARKNLTIIVAFTLLVTSFAFLSALTRYVRSLKPFRKKVHHAK